MTTKIINCTPHSIDVWLDDCIVHFEPDPEFLSRANRFDEVNPSGIKDDIWGIPVYLNDEDVNNLPEPEVGYNFIVSKRTAFAAIKRGRQAHDLLIPGGILRNSKNHEIGCRYFIRP